MPLWPWETKGDAEVLFDRPTIKILVDLFLPLEELGEGEFKDESRWLESQGKSKALWSFLDDSAFYYDCNDWLKNLPNEISNKFPFRSGKKAARDCLEVLLRGQYNKHKKSFEKLCVALPSSLSVSGLGLELALLGRRRTLNWGQPIHRIIRCT